MARFASFSSWKGLATVASAWLLQKPIGCDRQCAKGLAELACSNIIWQAPGRGACLKFQTLAAGIQAIWNTFAGELISKDAPFKGERFLFFARLVGRCAIWSVGSRPPN